MATKLALQDKKKDEEKIEKKDEEKIEKKDVEVKEAEPSDAAAHTEKGPDKEPQAHASAVGGGGAGIGGGGGDGGGDGQEPLARYSLMFYKRDNTVGVRQKFREKRQVLSFGGKTCGKTKAFLMELGDRVLKRLAAGDTYADTKTWARARCT
jgi:hypothetical protein